jgi:hypothetical protein
MDVLRRFFSVGGAQDPEKGGDGGWIEPQSSPKTHNTKINMDATSFTWELRVAQAEALLQAAERDKNAALREEAELRAEVAAAARRADDERLALAQAEARRYGLAAELMTCAKSTEELRERAAAERSEATA